MSSFNNLIERLADARNVCVLTGAGVSAESGIATFRDPDGLWAKFNPQELASMDGFLRNPDLVWEWYQFRRETVANAMPNAGHYAIAEMQDLFSNFILATQNVDRLHHRAGSRDVIELHGNIIENHCSRCEKPFQEPVDYLNKTILKCDKCGGNIRPAVVWFGEMLPEDAITQAGDAAETADVYFSIGTSAEVYPAANLPVVAKRAGAFVVEINPNVTQLSNFVDFRIAEPSAVALPKIIEAFKNVKK